MDFGPEGMEKKKAWKDIWGCGQGISAIKDVLSTEGLVNRLKKEYEEARDKISNNVA